MKKNIGSPERWIRMASGLAVSVLLLAGMFTGIAAAIAGMSGIYLLVTGFRRHCPFYRLIGYSTYMNLNDRSKLYQQNHWQHYQHLN